MIDILAISPHPDDAEIHCGGLLLLLKKQNYKTGILYMTKGEMGTEGNAKIREEETKKAMKILKVDFFDYAGFKDCQIKDSFQNRITIAKFIRKLKPKIVILPYWKGTPGRGSGHSDHTETGYLTSHAVNFARLKKIPINEKAHNVKQILYYLYPREMKPTFVVNISEVKDEWIKAISCHHSQMFGENPKETGFFNLILAEATKNGYYISKKYAHGFIAAEPLHIQNPFTLIENLTD